MKSKFLIFSLIFMLAISITSCSSKSSDDDNDDDGGSSNDPSPVTGLSAAGIYDNFDTAARDVVADGNYAYVATYTYGGDNGGLEIIDVTDKMNPLWKGGYIPTGSAYEIYTNYIAKYEDTVYISDSSIRTLIKIDVTVPGSPVAKAQVDGNGGSLYVKGNMLYISSYYSNALKLYDVSTNSAIMMTASYPLTSAGAITGFDDYVIVADGNTSILIIEPNSSGTVLSKTGEITTGGYPNICTDEDYLYSQFDTTLMITDISDPGAPDEASKTTIPQGGSIALTDNCLFIVAGNNIAMYDISDRKNPEKITDFSASISSVNGVSISGDYLYVADGGGGNGKLRIFKIEKNK